MEAIGIVAQLDTPGVHPAAHRRTGRSARGGGGDHTVAEQSHLPGGRGGVHVKAVAAEEQKRGNRIGQNVNLPKV